MKAVAAFPKDKKIRVVDHPEPERHSESQVTLRMLEVGLCGTDHEIATFEYGRPPPGSDYLVMGHESLAEVLEPGRDVRDVHPGDLVVVMVRRPCDAADCPACRMGRPDFCVTGKFTERGINGRHGFMTERVLTHPEYLVPVPKELRSVGVLVEPLTIAEKALIEVVNVQDRLPWLCDKKGERGGRAVVLGAGPVGLLGAMALRVRGFETWVWSREPSSGPKAEWVRSIGARYLCTEDVPVTQIGAKLGNVDLFYEATGSSAVAFPALEALGTNGVFIFTGVPGHKAPIEVRAADIMRRLVLKNQIFYGTVNAGREAFVHAVTDLKSFHDRWPAPLSALITDRCPLDRVPDLLLAHASGTKRVATFDSAR